MAKYLSEDLRLWVNEAMQNGASPRQAAARLGVSEICRLRSGPP